MATLDSVAKGSPPADDNETLSAAANDINRRRQEAQRRQAEADFLGGALRESERLRALTVGGAAGRDNPAFDADAFDSHDGPEFDSAAVLLDSPAAPVDDELDKEDDYDEDEIGDIGDFLRQLRNEDPEGYDDDDTNDDEDVREGTDADREQRRLVPAWLGQFLTSASFSAVYGLTRRVADAVNVAVFGDDIAFRGAAALTSSEAVIAALNDDAAKFENSAGDRQELLRLLSEPHLIGLMRTHDQAAVCVVPPELQPSIAAASPEPDAATASSSAPPWPCPAPESDSAPPSPPPPTEPKPGSGVGISLDNNSPTRTTEALLSAANIRVLVTAPTPSPSMSPSARSAKSAASSSTGDSDLAEADVASECRAETVLQDGVQFRRVTLVKRDSPLGATVKNIGDSVVVGRIVCGGLLDRVPGLLGEGDELISVNGIGLTGKHVNEVYELLHGLSGSLIFLTVPCTEYRPTERNNNISGNHGNNTNNNNNNVEEPLVLRALFTYEPAEDLYNPCREAGLAFQVGDLIRVLSTKDPNWWQGCKEFEAGSGMPLREPASPARSLAGIFPSPDFQRRRQLMLSMAADAEASQTGASNDFGSSSCGCWRRCQRCCLPLKRFQPRLLGRRRRDSRYSPADFSTREGDSSGGETSEGESDVIIEAEVGQEAGSSRGLRRRNKRHRPRRFFEPQALLQPQSRRGRPRPLVLVGPPGVGRHELRVGLIESDPGRFAPALLHTTRQPRPDETDGVDFQFVSRSEFQRRQREIGYFLETGQFNGDLYGTSASSVVNVLEAGLVCVLTMQPAGLRAIRRHPARLMPYCVFVSPPQSLNGLRALRRKLAPNSEAAPEDSDAELRQIIDLSRRMEESCGHLVDRVLVNTDPSASVAQLVGMATRLEREPQWVPARWLKPAATGATTAVGSRQADTSC